MVWPETRFLGYIRSTLEVHFFDFILGVITGGGRIRDVASLIRRTDEPEIKKIFWGEKSKKTFSPEAKKIF